MYFLERLPAGVSLTGVHSFITGSRRPQVLTSKLSSRGKAMIWYSKTAKQLGPGYSYKTLSPSSCH